MSDGVLTWSVDVPKNNVALGRKRPRARLSIGESETIEIPKAVAKRLSRLEGENAVFRSRAELLFRLRELSRACAHDRMEELVNHREYSAFELTRKLLDDGYPSSIAQEIVGRAQEVGIVSDERFCACFVRSKVSAGWGSQRILRELERRGIERDVIESIDGLLPNPEDELERAFGIASGRRLTGRDDYRKTVRHLVSRGFSLSVASSVARRVLDEVPGE